MNLLGYILGSVIKSADAAVMAVHAIYIPMLLLYWNLTLCRLPPMMS